MLRVLFALAAFAALANAQGLDLAAILAAAPVPTASVPVVYVTQPGASVATATTVSYVQAEASSSVAAAVSADPTNANIGRRHMDRRAAGSVGADGITTTAWPPVCTGSATDVYAVNDTKGTPYVYMCGGGSGGSTAQTVTNVASWRDCFSLCDASPACAGWSYNQGAVNGEGIGQCLIKSGKPNSFASTANLLSTRIAGIPRAYYTPTSSSSVATATTCVPQPSGISHSPSPDTASAFLSDPYFAAQANQAAVPAGYTKIFTNLNASNQAYGYLGYTTLTTYDTQTCANKCSAITGCMAVNIYFERDPSVNPNDASCANPSSTTNIKCVFWGGPVAEWNALNHGQWRNNFQVVVAGSNGYVNNSISYEAGYNAPVSLGSAAIDAPNDCSGSGTYLGVKLFTSGVFDPNLCLAACTAQTEYNMATAPKDGHALSCQFFTTYILYKNGLPVGQYCSLYSMEWNSSYATNKGMQYGDDLYTIGSSYSFTNTTSPGAPYYACDVASATSAIESATLQPYCSTLLGYDTAISTVTATVLAAAGATTTPSVNLTKAKRAIITELPVKRANAATPSALAGFSASAITSACSLEATSVASALVAVTVTVTATS